jgi:hypothetical protein
MLWLLVFLFCIALLAAWLLPRVRGWRGRSGIVMSFVLLAFIGWVITKLLDEGFAAGKERLASRAGSIVGRQKAVYPAPVRPDTVRIHEVIEHQPLFTLQSMKTQVRARDTASGTVTVQRLPQPLNAPASGLAAVQGGLSCPRAFVCTYQSPYLDARRDSVLPWSCVSSLSDASDGWLSAVHGGRRIYFPTGQELRLTVRLRCDD